MNINSKQIILDESENSRFDFFTNGEHLINILKIHDKYIIYYDNCPNGINGAEPFERRIINMVITCDYIEGMIPERLKETNELHEMNIKSDIINEVQKYTTGSVSAFYDIARAQNKLVHVDVYVSRTERKINYNIENLLTNDHFAKAKSARK